MRRQARKSVGGALVVRSASALQVWLWLLLFVFQNEFRICWSIEPGYLNYDELPETNFTCTGKVIGGYYADLETSCQMFHVCTVGNQDEPMDIKFLCNNGTVFDQETRVCERVDEVDCTKSEKFYSLNLELYGNTAPPIIPPEPDIPHVPENEQTQKQNKTIAHILADPFISESPTTPDKIQNHSTDIIDSTEDPVQDYKKDDSKNTSTQRVIPAKPNVDLDEEYEEEEEEAIDNEGSEYEEDYSHPLTTTTVKVLTTTTTPTKKPITSTTISTPSTNLPFIPSLITGPPPPPPSLPPLTSPRPSFQTESTLDPALLSPQEFIYRHRGPGSEAISFQRQSFRPADGVYITHAPSQQFDHFQYESSRTAPRPAVAHPAPFVQRPNPTPFRPTTNDPRNQILRPTANSQSSERHETTIKHRHQNFPSHLPPQPPLPFNPFYYDRKRSDDIPENESTLSARSVAPPTDRERVIIKPKSPPRVIVTASASVSDSNGKKLNYTVGNVVSAVKPIVPINYDDYKESDLIFDPFFLDVPKLKGRRKTRSSNYRKIISVPATTIETINKIPEKTATTNTPITSQATTVKASSFAKKPTSTVKWIPEDYVDDNYEPHAYVPPVPPLAILLNRDFVKSRRYDKQSDNILARSKTNDVKSSQSESTLSETRKISSQNVGTEAAVPVTSPSPFGAPTCVTSRTSDCRTRA